MITAETSKNDKSNILFYIDCYTIDIAYHCWIKDTCKINCLPKTQMNVKVSIWMLAHVPHFLTRVHQGISRLKVCHGTLLWPAGKKKLLITKVICYWKTKCTAELASWLLAARLCILYITRCISVIASMLNQKRWLCCRQIIKYNSICF